MRIFFAAVGNELMDSFLSGTGGEEKNLLFSFWELSGNSGFKQRLKNWNNIMEGRDAIAEERID